MSAFQASAPRTPREERGHYVGGRAASLDAVTFGSQGRHDGGQPGADHKAAHDACGSDPCRIRADDQVVIYARRAGQPVATSDPGVLRALDPP